METRRATSLPCQFGNFDAPLHRFLRSRCHPCAHVQCRGGPTCPPDCTTGMDARPDADERRSRSTNANRCVVQNAPPAEMERKEETTLKRSNGHWQDSTAFGVVVFCGGAAGDASRHATVICCGDGFTVRPADVERYNHIMDQGMYQNSILSQWRRGAPRLYHVNFRFFHNGDAARHVSTMSIGEF